MSPGSLAIVIAAAVLTPLVLIGLYWLMANYGDKILEKFGGEKR